MSMLRKLTGGALSAALLPVGRPGVRQAGRSALHRFRPGTAAGACVRADREKPLGSRAQRNRGDAQGLPQFPSRPPDQGRPADGPHHPAEHLWRQRCRHGRRTGRRPARRGDRPPARLPEQAGRNPGAALPAATAAGPEACRGRRHPEIAALPLSERQRHAALRRRLLHHPRQTRRRQAQGRRQENARRRLSRHLQPAAQEAYRLLRQRRLPHQLPQRMGQDARASNGHGIWLHGTPSDTFSRPPKASDGCVVLANTDLDALAKNLQIGTDPGHHQQQHRMAVARRLAGRAQVAAGRHRRMAAATGKAATSTAMPAITRRSFPATAKILPPGSRRRKRSMPASSGSRSARKTSACSAIRARTNTSSSPSSRTTRAATCRTG